MLPPQLILACVQLIMEREGIAASPAFASASASSPFHLGCAAAGFGGAGARHFLILSFWAEELGEILCHSPLPPVSFKRLGQPWEGCYLLVPQFPPVAGSDDVCRGISQVSCTALSRHFPGMPELWDAPLGWGAVTPSKRCPSQPRPLLHALMAAAFLGLTSSAVYSWGRNSCIAWRQAAFLA